MAYLIAKADGNLTAVGTWGTVETGTAAVQLTKSASTTTTTSYVWSSAITVGSIDMDGLLLHCKQTTATGTITVCLSVDGAAETRTVTINASDLPLYPTWVLFKFGSAVTGDSGAGWKVGVKGSSAGNATFYRDGTAGNWTRLIRNTADPGSVAAADWFYIAGGWTAAATVAVRTVTMDSTAATDYGQMRIGDNGTLNPATTAATAFILRLSGDLEVWANGIFWNTGVNLAADSTFVLEFDCTSDGEFGLLVKDGGKTYAHGNDLTAGNVVYCKLAANAAVNATTLTTDIATGWKDNDVLVIGKGGLSSGTETGAVNVAPIGTALTVDGFGGVAGGVAYAHNGQNGFSVPVINLTRNVKIYSTNASFATYILASAAAVVDFDWLEIYNIAANAANKYGFTVQTESTGSFSIEYCAIYNCRYIPFRANGDTIANVTVSHNVWYNAPYVGTSGFQFYGSGGEMTVHNNVFIKGNGTTNSTNTIIRGDYVRCTDNIFCDWNGSNWYPLFFLGVSILECTGNEFISAGPIIFNIYGLSIVARNTIDNCKFWYGGFIRLGWSVGSSGSHCHGLTFSNCIFAGGGGAQLYFCSDIIFDTCVFAGLSFLYQSTGISAPAYGGGSFIRARNCSFGVVTGDMIAHSTASIGLGASDWSLLMINCVLADAVEVANYADGGNFSDAGYVRSMHHNQVVGSAKTWTRGGVSQNDTTIKRSSIQSARMTPVRTDKKGKLPILQVPLAAGQTATVTVYVRESVAGDGTDYNGNRIRLMVEEDDIPTGDLDQTVATATAASEGAWEAIEGSVGPVTATGVLKFYIDCDGTTGWINVDDSSYTVV